MIAPSEQIDPLVPARVVRRDFLPVHNSTLCGWVRDGRFPPPIYLAGRRFWRKSTLEAWFLANATTVAPEVK